MEYYPSSSNITPCHVPSRVSAWFHNSAGDIDFYQVSLSQSESTILQESITLIYKYLDCRNGWYGSGCETPCGHCFGQLEKLSMSKINCIELLAYKNGWYSSGCETPCGYCFSGSCPGNCSDGYTEETCSNDISYFLWLKYNIVFKDMLFKVRFISLKRKITTLFKV